MAELARAEWKCAWTKPGGQCATPCGTTGMLRWSAGVLDFPRQVIIASHCITCWPIAGKVMIFILLFYSLSLHSHAFVGSRAVSNSFFGGGSGSVALNRLGCRGNESSLLDCSHVRGSFSFFCTLHTEDAGVRCATGATRKKNGMADIISSVVLVI